VAAPASCQLFVLADLVVRRAFLFPGQAAWRRRRLCILGIPFSGPVSRPRRFLMRCGGACEMLLRWCASSGVQGGYRAQFSWRFAGDGFEDNGFSFGA
jgi:hypothetical protein